MKKFISILFSLLLISAAFAQNRYMVYFSDKGNVSNINIEHILSERAIKNHTKNKVTLNKLDFPLNSNYLKQIAEVATIAKTSKWLNAVIVKSNASVETILAFPFVKKVEILATGAIYQNDKFKNEEKLNYNKILDYDSTYKQNIQIK